MACSPNGIESSFLQTICILQSSGLLDEFLRTNPQHLAGVELARGMLQRSRANRGSAGSCNSRASRNPQSAGPAPNIPSASSVKYFVTLISNLVEEQCPMRSDPNSVQCEDKCLAALQIAICECLKLVRQNKGCPKCSPPLPAWGKQEPVPPQINYSQLAQKLDCIPEPACAEKCEEPEKPKCGFPRGPNSNPHDEDTNFLNPVAGSFSDGIGGHKVKGYPYDVKKTEVCDGIGGGKIKGIED